MKPLKSTLKTSLALLCLGLLTAGQTQATTITWNGTSGANWSTNSSWTGSVPPADNTTTDTAQFTVATSGTVNLSAVRSVAALDIQRDTTFTGQALTLSSTAGVTDLALAAGVTAVFNNLVYSDGGNRTLASGSTLTLNGGLTSGGKYLMTNATVNLGGSASVYSSPLFQGTGVVNYASTAATQNSMRLAMDGVNFTFKSSSVDPTSATTSSLQFAGTDTLTLERNVNFTAGTGSASVGSQYLGVGWATSAVTKVSNLTISGTYQAQFNQLLFGVYNGNTITMDGSTLLISGNQKQGVFLTDVNGGAYDSWGLNTYTITSTSNGGTVRVGANATSSFNANANLASNYGATLLVSGNATLINNGAWTNKNYTTNTTYTGLQVNSTATLGGNGSFDMSSGNGTNAKNTIISGTVAPGDGGIGTLSINGGNVTLSGTAKYELGTAGVSHGSPGTSDRLVVGGALALGGTLNLIDNAGANGNGSVAPGAYLLFTYTGTLSNSFGSITNVTGYHGKIVDGGAGTGSGQGVFLDNYKIAQAATTQTVNMSFHVGVATTTAVTLANTAPVNATYTETLSSGAFSSTSANFTATGSASGIAGGGIGSGTLLVGVGAGLGAGAQSGSTVLALNSDAVNSSGLGTTGLTAQTITINATGYNLASTGFSTTSVTLATIHTGASFGTQSLSINNTLGAGTYNETLGAAFANASGVTTSGSPITVAAGAAANTSMNVGFSSSSAGAHSGTVDVQFNSQAVNSSGLGTTALTSLNKTITVTGAVFNGTGVWTSSSNSSWGSAANWTDSNVVHAAPGTFVGYDNVDTATLNGNGTTATVNLGAVTPSIKALNLSGSTAYTIAQDSTGVLQFKSDTGTATITADTTGHTISTAVTLASNLSVAVTNSGDRLTVSGNIGGGSGLTKTGAGELVLSGNNTFSGATAVTGGTLTANATNALGSTSGITVSTGGTLLLDASTATNSTATLKLDGGTVALNPATGVSNTLGALTLTANSTIDFGTITTGNNILTLGGVTTWTPGQILNIWNWSGTPRTAGGTDQLRVSSTSSWSDTDLANIKFFTGSGTGLIGGGGAMFVGLELTAVPEPSTWIAMAALLITGGAMAMGRRTTRQGTKDF